VLQATIARIDEDDVSKLRSWLASLSDRRSELRESYRRHGTRHELFLLIRTLPLPILVLVAEVENDEEAASSFLRSNLPIDVEFKTLVQEISPEEAEVELLYDSKAYVGAARS
jgi:hypothetical protein